MALHDWNHDGKKDWQDRWIEYQIYQEAAKQKKDFPDRTSGSGVSTLGAVLSVVGGLFLCGLLLALFVGDNVEKVPVVILLILWGICGAVFAVFCDHHGI